MVAAETTIPRFSTREEAYKNLNPANHSLVSLCKHCASVTEKESEMLESYQQYLEKHDSNQHKGFFVCYPNKHWLCELKNPPPKKGTLIKSTVQIFAGESLIKLLDRLEGTHSIAWQLWKQKHPKIFSS